MDWNRMTDRLGPVSSIVLAVFLVILGVLVISVPQIIRSEERRGGKEFR